MFKAGCNRQAAGSDGLIAETKAGTKLVADFKQDAARSQYTDQKTARLGGLIALGDEKRNGERSIKNNPLQQLL